MTRLGTVPNRVILIQLGLSPTDRLAGFLYRAAKFDVMMNTFVHLHNHSQYSLLDGAASLDQLIERAVQLGMPAIALTDHGVMHGFVKFYEKAKAAGIKPIIGCEVYMARRGRQDRVPGIDENPYHLVLLAKNAQGFANLSKLVSKSHLEGYYYKPRIDRELLATYGEGLIGLSACLSGELATLTAERRTDEAQKAVVFYQDVFGRENFFVELQDQGLEGQYALNRKLIELARATGAPLVATNDVHYLEREDAAAHDVLLCIQTGAVLSQQNRMRFSNDQFYLRSYQEMYERFRDIPEALTNTLMIAERCECELTLGKPRLPDYAVPGGFTKASYLRHLCEENLPQRYGKTTTATNSATTSAITDRLDYELRVINQMGFPGYFLIVHDFVQYAKQAGIMVGPGRGSAAGSIVSYLLGITDLDPLEYGLMFERFLNPERISMPDIDIDFCYERRGEVIDYVRRKYGEDHVAQIVTFGTLAARAAVRDVGRVLGMTYGEVDAVAKQIPQEVGISLDAALKDNAELAKAYQENERVRQLLDIARKVEGFPRHASVHAAGIVIAPEELEQLIPLQRSSEDEVCTQITMDDIEHIGLLKMDLLGLRTLTVLQNARNLVRQNHGVVIDPRTMPHADPPTGSLLSKAATIGVFQLESPGMRRLIANLRPETLEDLVPLMALYRPGPLGSGMVDDFIRGRHGQRETEYLHPSLEPVLKETYGVILYQEQVMQISNVLAGFSLAEADVLRRAMGKKKPQEIAAMKQRFLAGAASKGVAPEIAEHVFTLMEFFSGYGFNKSHSAAYAVVAYETAYLKANYPLEYMCALISSVIGSSDKVAQYIEECRTMGIPIYGPDVNYSDSEFKISESGIRFGLLAVKNVGRQAIELIVSERASRGKYLSIYDFCRRVPGHIVNKRVLESLIKAGAFGSTGKNRRETLMVLDKALEGGAVRHAEGQLSFFDLAGSDGFMVNDETWVQAEEFPAGELLRLEREMLGAYISGHPLDHWQTLLKKIGAATTAELKESEDGQEKTIGGLAVHIKNMTTRMGRRMAVIQLEDVTGSMEVVVFPDTLIRMQRPPSVDDVLLVRGKLERRDEDLKLLVSQIRILNLKSS